MRRFITYQSFRFSAMEPSRLHLRFYVGKYMIFKINPSFVLPRSLGCLSVCLFIVPIWSRINFTPLFVPFAVGVGGKRRGELREIGRREKRKRERKGV